MANYFLADSLMSSLGQMRSKIQKTAIRKVLSYCLISGFDSY